MLRTACALVGDDEGLIEWTHLPDDVAEELVGRPAQRAVHDTDTDLRLQAGRCVQEAVRTSNGNMSEAARRLGISRNTLYRSCASSSNRSQSKKPGLACARQAERDRVAMLTLEDELIRALGTAALEQVQTDEGEFEGRRYACRHCTPTHCRNAWSSWSR